MGTGHHQMTPHRGQPPSCLPQEDFLHGGDRGAVAGDAQLLPLLLQLCEQGLKPERRSEALDADAPERGHSEVKTLWASVLQLV